MGQDFSMGTEAFREALLERCLDELDADVDESEECADIDDAQLELLAAAGDPFLLDPSR